MTTALTVVAVLLGLALAWVVAVVVRPTPGVDPSMVWEGRVATGFAGVVAGVPLVVAQVVVTIVAGGGRLWIWLLAAPLLGLVLSRVPRPRRTGG